MEINQETYDTIIKIGEGIKKFFTELRQSIEGWVRRNWKLLKEVAVKWYQLEEEKQVVVRHHHKRDFSRQKISHQVIDRKPRKINRRIIR